MEERERERESRTVKEGQGKKGQAGVALTLFEWLLVQISTELLANLICLSRGFLQSLWVNTRILFILQQSTTSSVHVLTCQTFTIILPCRSMLF